MSEVLGERDFGRRGRATGDLYAEDCTPYDADESIGQAAVSDRVGILGERPPALAFSLVDPTEVIYDLGRLRSHTGPAGAGPVLSGMDVAVFANAFGP